MTACTVRLSPRFFSRRLEKRIIVDEDTKKTFKLIIKHGWKNRRKNWLMLQVMHFYSLFLQVDLLTEVLHFSESIQGRQNTTESNGQRYETAWYGRYDRTTGRFRWTTTNASYG